MADQRGQVSLAGTLVGSASASARPPCTGIGTHGARWLRRQRDLTLDLRQAFVRGRETVGELRLRETVLERVDRVRSAEVLDLAVLDFAPSVFAASVPALGALPH